jgi:hypothetical protein
VVLKGSVHAKEGIFDSDDDELLQEEGSLASLKKRRKKTFGTLVRHRGGGQHSMETPNLGSASYINNWHWVGGLQPLHPSPWAMIQSMHPPP